ncbi:MAG TPA: FAD-binding protein, partial [Acidimicrobiales bacterium]|nr:FAD-binding protein [Acidimicrobiales bacterium]
LLVVGSGVAGLSATLRATGGRAALRTGVLTKGRLADSATAWAQGGVAAVLPGRARSPGDSPDLHRADTMAAGGGLCDPAAVEVCVTEGPARLSELVGLGARFDRDAGGRLELAREGGHSTARVVHAGGAATGAEIERALVAATRAGAAAVWEGFVALDLIVEGGRCRGVRALNPAGTAVEVRATHTLLATGGAGQLYALTTNPAQSTGDGLAMALRAGVACADVEFFQFHPTALAAPASPRPLLSEALRGEGARLRDGGGHRFVDELAPRDVVAAAMTARMLEQGSDHLWLDARDVDRFAERFPSLARVLAASGLDPRRDWLPVAPAAHYHCGGVLTDLDGATTLPGLWAAGEVACTGLHGANRLASNSLLEGMVFSARVVEAMLRGKVGPSPTGALRPRGEGWPPGPGPSAGDVIGWAPLAWQPVPAVASADSVKARELLQAAMTAGAGVLRTLPSLDDTQRTLRRVGWADPEGANLVTVAAAVVAAARARGESRGAHRRGDFPATDPRQRFRWWVG